MDGWKGDLAMWAVNLAVIGGLICWLRLMDARDKRKAEREEIRRVARVMVREMNEQEELERMWRISR